MFCPDCKNPITYVIDSRVHQDGQSIRRRRECSKCSNRFTTFERLETKNLIVIKKDASREGYSREKLKQGIWKACEKRKITEDDIENLLNSLEEKWYCGSKEVASQKIGEDLMEALKELDEVAYIRFASVYREFKDVETFKKELQKLIK